MPRVGEQDLERMEQARLDDDLIAELATTARECTFLFTASDGWPAGVTMSHLYADGVFWLTSVGTRAQVRAARRDPRVGLVISSLGTGLDGRRMVRVKGHAQVLDDPGTRARMLPRISEHLAPGGAERLRGLLDSPDRVLIRVEPVSFPQTHDSRRVSGDGRGGARG
ncbi:pyridoxamine 5'-phosphate oxidase family protein [Pseudonocardia sp. KRD291]|uniref:pyridoxamine 5'-phosphate oxidase family protein n=1 Tax=Pseudonocardia sp. KRD291 TaxID=2792007 RepID=UPI001C49DE95|nr:pyridoxamine 5'-phosphate oxidase family protein [Pseudonocardia sp. KRD291]